MATRNRTVKQGLIFQSDKGVQNVNNKFANVMNTYKKITKSISRQGICWNNLVAESFFK